LSETSLDQLEQRTSELVLRSEIDYAFRRFQEYIKSELTWGATHAGVLNVRPVAYFSAEFGLHESLPIYSGGLGLLAGDHIQSASALGAPLVGVGLPYSHGYFSQRLDAGGWQREESKPMDVNRRPLTLATDEADQPITIQVETRTGHIAARVWRLA